MIQYGGQSGEIKWMGLLNELEDKNLMAGIEMVWTISLSFTGSFEGIYSNTKVQRFAPSIRDNMTQQKFALSAGVELYFNNRKLS